MKQYYKLFSFVILVLLYFLTAAPFFLMGKLYPYKVKGCISRLCQYYAKAALFILGVKYSVNNASGTGNHLIVANHLSYLDILLMASLRPTCFVTSVEVRNTPFLGQICEFGGCLYVERRSRENLDNEIQDITNALESGLNVTIFPEATSTNGNQLKRFKRPLFKAAINSNRKVVPVSINYKRINNIEVDIYNRDIIFWYDDMTFGSHIWNLMKIDRIDAILVYSDEIFDTCETMLSLSAHSAVKKNLDVYS